jgi:hypothetical protein
MSDFKSEAKKKIQILTTEADHRRLAALASSAEVDQGFALHVLLELIELVVGSAVESGLIDDKTKISNLEAFTALSMHFLGLLSPVEFERELLICDVMKGKNTNMRLQGLAVHANQRMDELRPIWEVSRIEAKARRAMAWLEERSALKQALAAQQKTAVEVVPAGE